MKISCHCTVPTDIDERAEMISIYTPKALKHYLCDECENVIRIGVEYRKEIYKFDSIHHIHKTCEDCLSVREVFFSSGYYGCIWIQMKDFIADVDGDLSVSCLLDLTKSARGRILDMIEKHWRIEDE